MPALRELAKKVGENHTIAEELWACGIHEGRILASLIDIPKMVTEEQMELWVSEFDSWDVCDQCCMNLFRKTAFAWEKAQEWCLRSREFEKRAGFALIATLAVHEKKKGDGDFEALIGLIKMAADDERNFVKKAVNWALRQIGKRNEILCKRAAAAAEELSGRESKSARWIGRDALRELSSEATLARIQSKSGKSRA